MGGINIKTYKQRTSLGQTTTGKPISKKRAKGRRASDFSVQWFGKDANGDPIYYLVDVTRIKSVGNNPEDIIVARLNDKPQPAVGDVIAPDGSVDYKYPFFVIDTKSKDSKDFYIGNFGHLNKKLSDGSKVYDARKGNNLLHQIKSDNLEMDLDTAQNELFLTGTGIVSKTIFESDDIFKEFEDPTKKESKTSLTTVSGARKLEDPYENPVYDPRITKPVDPEVDAFLDEILYEENIMNQTEILKQARDRINVRLNTSEEELLNKTQEEILMRKEREDEFGGGGL